MIEHFKKFDAEDVKSILPLSFSQITDFAFNRERWALRRIFGYEFPSSAAAARGKAVESGLNMILNGMDFDNASKKMGFFLVYLIFIFDFGFFSSLFRF